MNTTAVQWLRKYVLPNIPPGQRHKFEYQFDTAERMELDQIIDAVLDNSTLKKEDAYKYYKTKFKK